MRRSLSAGPKYRIGGGGLSSHARPWRKPCFRLIQKDKKPEIGAMVVKSQQTGRVVVLNGIGSIGKSSIAKALQQIANEPMLHVQMDAFLEMLPEALHDHPDGYAYETIHEGGKPLVVIKGGP